MRHGNISKLLASVNALMSRYGSRSLKLLASQIVVVQAWLAVGLGLAKLIGARYRSQPSMSALKPIRDRRRAGVAYTGSLERRMWRLRRASGIELSSTRSTGRSNNASSSFLRLK